MQVLSIATDEYNISNEEEDTLLQEEDIDMESTQDNNMPSSKSERKQIVFNDDDDDNNDDDRSRDRFHCERGSYSMSNDFPPIPDSLDDVVLKVPINDFRRHKKKFRNKSRFNDMNMNEGVTDLRQLIGYNNSDDAYYEASCYAPDAQFNEYESNFNFPEFRQRMHHNDINFGLKVILLFV